MGLRSHRPGSFLVRPSERSPGDYALAFRTNTDTRHWRIVKNSGRFYVHPRPNPYNSLPEIIQVGTAYACQHYISDINIIRTVASSSNVC